LLTALYSTLSCLFQEYAIKFVICANILLHALCTFRRTALIIERLTAAKKYEQTWHILTGVCARGIYTEWESWPVSISCRPYWKDSNKSRFVHRVDFEHPT